MYKLKFKHTLNRLDDLLFINMSCVDFILRVTVKLGFEVTHFLTSITNCLI